MMSLNITESQVIKVMLAVQNAFGLLTEFTAVIDDRNGRSSRGYLVEAHDELNLPQCPRNLRHTNSTASESSALLHNSI